MSEIIASLSEISDRYDALFRSLGCVHDGVRAYNAANEALISYRKAGGKVVLVTNSPKPRSGVEKQLLKFGVLEDAWDSIATSGDSARAAMYQGVVGKRVYFIGEPRDAPFFEPMTILESPMLLSEWHCLMRNRLYWSLRSKSRPFGDVLLFASKRAKIVRQPDIVVDRGYEEWCAGALPSCMQRWAVKVFFFGKPHPPIYDLALRRLCFGFHYRKTAPAAIGDGIQTDIRGRLANIDSLFSSQAGRRANKNQRSAQ